MPERDHTVLVWAVWSDFGTRLVYLAHETTMYLVDTLFDDSSKAWLSALNTFPSWDDLQAWAVKAVADVEEAGGRLICDPTPVALSVGAARELLERKEAKYSWETATPHLYDEVETALGRAA